MNLKKSDDTLLIRLIAEKEARALDELYDRYHRLVFSIAMAIVDDRSIAEEVTLDVFVHVWRGAKTYRPERAKVITWLTAITRHHAIDVLRWHRSRLDHQSLYLDDLPLQIETESIDLPEQIESDLRSVHIRQVVAGLPVDQRKALILAYFKGYSQQEIAEILGEPLGTIKTRIRLAMQKLREVLSKEPQFPGKSEKD